MRTVCTQTVGEQTIPPLSEHEEYAIRVEERRVDVLHTTAPDGHHTHEGNGEGHQVIAWTDYQHSVDVLHITAGV